MNSKSQSVSGVARLGAFAAAEVLRCAARHLRPRTAAAMPPAAGAREAFAALIAVVTVLRSGRLWLRAGDERRQAADIGAACWRLRLLILRRLLRLVVVGMLLRPRLIVRLAAVRLRLLARLIVRLLVVVPV